MFFQDNQANIDYTIKLRGQVEDGGKTTHNILAEVVEDPNQTISAFAATSPEIFISDDQIINT